MASGPIAAVPPRRPVMRALGIFWGTVLLLTGTAAVALQLLGPPDTTPQQTALATAPTPVRQVAPSASAHSPAPPSVFVPRAPGAAIIAPDPALQEPSRAFEGANLPRIGPDGRMPRQAYAAGYDPAARGPRIALLVADFGMNEQDSDEAMRSLPAAVSLAVSPYAQRRAERLVAAAHARGHETLAALPLEPQGYPQQNDAGSHALLTGAPPAANALQLEWALSRFDGNVGATGALGRLHGERYAAATELYATLLEEVARRGLLYIDPRPGGTAPKQAGMPPYRAADVVVDAPPIRAQIDAQLARLEQIARERGSALGLATGTMPLTVDRIAAWAVSLPARGYTLVPVSALAAQQDTQ